MSTILDWTEEDGYRRAVILADAKGNEYITAHIRHSSIRGWCVGAGVPGCQLFERPCSTDPETDTPSEAVRLAAEQALREAGLLRHLDAERALAGMKEQPNA